MHIPKGRGAVVCKLTSLQFCKVCKAYFWWSSDWNVPLLVILAARVDWVPASWDVSAAVAPVGEDAASRLIWLGRETLAGSPRPGVRCSRPLPPLHPRHLSISVYPPTRAGRLYPVHKASFPWPRGPREPLMLFWLNNSLFLWLFSFCAEVLIYSHLWHTKTWKAWSPMGSFWHCWWFATQMTVFKANLLQERHANKVTISPGVNSLIYRGLRARWRSSQGEHLILQYWHSTIFKDGCQQQMLLCTSIHEFHLLPTFTFCR